LLSSTENIDSVSICENPGIKELSIASTCSYKKILVEVLMPICAWT
jgi:hypothetical protein